MNEAFHIVRPQGRRLPVVVSCPHSGTEIPPELAAAMDPELARAVPDTDWFVHELYSFAPELGITVIHARYSRFVIDLNRDPEGKKLYADGRAETSLVPVTTFGLARLYRGAEPDETEIARRRRTYYDPYHQQVAALVQELKGEFPHVLLYEAHSIKRLVTSIRKDPFPDLMLGDQKGRTADARLTGVALEELRRSGEWTVQHNDPFMGGYLTRRFGQPHTGVHALQLEMSQDVYMDEDRAARDPAKQEKMQVTLRRTLAELARTVEGLR